MGSQHRCGLQRVLPHFKTRVRHFITDRRGAAAMFLGLGTHKELLKNCKVYQEIAYSQLSKEELENG